jgi:hypothetical protein
MHNNCLVLAPVAVKVNVAEEILRVLEVGVLLRAAQAGALLGLVLFTLVVLFILGGFAA